MKLDQFHWVNEPKTYHITDEELRITTQPHTDLWQRTYYHFVNDNAPVYLMPIDDLYFSFIVKTNFEQSHTRFDQCGVVIYQDSRNWIKGSIEYENEQFDTLWKLLVPSRGKANSVQGEVVRIAGIIQDEIHRNGGINWSNEYRKQLVTFEQFLSSGNMLVQHDMQVLRDAIQYLLGKKGDIFAYLVSFVCML